MTKTTCAGTVDVPPYTRSDGTNVAGYTRICPYPHDGKEPKEKKLNLKKSVGRNVNADMADVKNLKIVLYELGYYQPNVRSEGLGDFHGYPNQELDDAIRSFQRDHGLTADGAIKPDGETENEINAVLDAKIVAERNYSPVPKGFLMSDDELIKRAYQDIANHEGIKNHGYADTVEKYTAGTGKMYPDATALKKANFLMPDKTTIANDADKQKEYDRVMAKRDELEKKYGRNPDPKKPYNFLPSAYYDKNKSLVYQDAEQVALEHLKGNLRELRSAANTNKVNFDLLSKNVKLVLLDLRYNTGGGQSKRWIELWGHIKNEDWDAAGDVAYSFEYVSTDRKESRRKGIRGY